MLFTLPELTRATVVSRPSKVIKSPYVADIRVGDDLSVVQCHSPGLGCGGMVAAGTTVYVSRNAGDTKTSYTTHVAEVVDSDGTVYVGIHPMISQKIAGLLLDRICLDVCWKTEVACLDSRLDFVGDCANGKKVYVEVKNAMICKDLSVGRGSRRALFPDGYRSPGSITTSPRAVKHAETLTALAKLQDTEAAYLVFIVPRDDCGGLELNRADPVYCSAVLTALRAGVKVVVFGLTYKKDGAIDFYKRLPLIIP